MLKTRLLNSRTSIKMGAKMNSDFAFSEVIKMVSIRDNCVVRKSLGAIGFMSANNDCIWYLMPNFSRNV